MKMSDITCPSCLASYEVAESTSAEGSPGHVQCRICGGVLASWQEPKMRGHRLIFPPQQKYFKLPGPPSPVHWVPQKIAGSPLSTLAGLGISMPPNLVGS